MAISIWFPIAITILILVCLIIISYNRFFQKKTVNNYYTPFDHITGQTEVAFHEEKLDKEISNEEGDDKDKNQT